MKNNTLSKILALLLLLTFSNAWAKPPTSPIVEGTRVDATEFPYVAQLKVGGETQCTGTLVASRFVLTAAHCFFGDNNKQSVGDTDMTAVLGGVSYPSTKVYINPAYVSRSSACVEGETDAAVLELASEVQGITPITMVDTVPAVGSVLQLAGFGLEGNGSSGQNDNLPPAGKINIGNTVLEGYGDNIGVNNPNSSYIYWGFEQGESNTASGDSGGPAFFQPANEKFLAAITCGGDGNAEFGTSSYDTRVDLIKSWVLSIAGSTPGGTAPGFTKVRTISTGLNQSVNYRIPFTGSSPVTLTVTGLPAGLTFDGTSIVGTPTETGTFTAQVEATNAFGNSSTSIKIVVAGFNSSLSITKVLLQFDYVKGARDFLDVDGKITLGKNFKPANKKILVQIGRFSREFKMRANGQSASSNKNFFDLVGSMSNGKFKSASVKYLLTIEKQSIFDEIATLGFPNSENASAGQEVPLPITVTVDGVESAVTATLAFRERDARWVKKK